MEPKKLALIIIVICILGGVSVILFLDMTSPILPSGILKTTWLSISFVTPSYKYSHQDDVRGETKVLVSASPTLAGEHVHLSVLYSHYIPELGPVMNQTDITVWFENSFLRLSDEESPEAQTMLHYQIRHRPLKVGTYHWTIEADCLAHYKDTAYFDIEITQED